MNRSERPDLSIVIVNRNTRDLLHACLRSIEANREGLEVEVIVVDNGSSDGSLEMVKDSFPGCKLIRNPSNAGFAYPNNQGLAVSSGRYVMLLNSDTEVMPRALGRLISFMDDHPGVGACGPKLLFPDGRLQRSCGSFPTPWRHLCDMLFLDRLLPWSRSFGNQYTVFDHDRTAEVDQPAGAALLVRRTTVESVGTLDERFTIYYNDADWCYRIRQAGWLIYFVHDAEVIHHLRASTRSENRRMELAAEMMRNAFDYHAKHFGPGGLTWYRFWLLVGFGIRRIVSGLVVRLHLNDSEPDYPSYVRGAFRVGWSGDPDRFVPDRRESCTH